MSRSTRTAWERGATFTLWLTAVMLSGVACRDDNIAGPSDQEGVEAGPSLAVTASAPAFAQVSAGADHTCGLTTGGQLYCWGHNGSGQLGDGTTVRHALPTLVAGGLLFRQVSAGVSHTCAVTTDYRAYCWGYNATGQLGDGTTVHPRLTPVAVAGGRAFRQISAGFLHTCALTRSTTNKIYCWGTGYLGNGSYGQFTTPQVVAGARTYRQVGAGWYHTCAVTTTYKAFCWGPNSYGQLGNGATKDFIAVNPVAVAGTLQFRQVSAGGSHTCAVTTTNKAYCWGNGRNGETGDGKTYLRFTPKAVLGGLAFGRVSAGDGHTCGETTGDQAYCWGSNFWGQLGDGTRTNRPMPTAVQGGLVFKQLAAGSGHTCGVASGYLAWCWGSNFEGELGNGTYSSQPYVSPSPVQ
jgi:alpha-tubulin suppressor-like RCC1 family protein